MCSAGAWLPEWPRRGGRSCSRCPHGALCPGGDALPIAAPGYWSDEAEVTRVIWQGESERVPLFWRCAAGELGCLGGDALAILVADPEIALRVREPRLGQALVPHGRRVLVEWTPVGLNRSFTFQLAGMLSAESGGTVHAALRGDDLARERQRLLSAAPV